MSVLLKKIAKKINNIFEELLPKIILLRARFENCQKHTMSIPTCCMSINKSAQGLRVFVVGFQQTFTTFTFKISNQFVGLRLLSQNGQITWSTLHYFFER